MLDILKLAGIVQPKIWCGAAEEMERSFAEARRQKLEILIVLGGDGTIRTAAEACTKEGLYLIPLPGGTMNMLPQALYGDVSWRDALKSTLATPSPKLLSSGRIADKRSKTTDLRPEILSQKTRRAEQLRAGRLRRHQGGPGFGCAEKSLRALAFKEEPPTGEYRRPSAIRLRQSVRPNH